MTATKSRKKQQTEQMEAALKAEEDRKCRERENFLITSVPVTSQASYEPALHHTAGDDHDDGPSSVDHRLRDQNVEKQSKIVFKKIVWDFFLHLWKSFPILG